MFKITDLSVFFLFVVFSVFLFPRVVFAHSGRTDSSGGHNCNVGSCAGTYHYHNGGPAKAVVPIVYPTAVPTRVVYPTSVPTRVPTVRPTSVPTLVPTVVLTSVPSLEPTAVVVPSVVPSVEAEVLGVVDDEGSSDDLSGGDVLLTLGLLGGSAWAGVKGTKVGVRGVKRVMRKMGGEREKL